MEKIPIKIISPEFNLLGEIDDYESLIFIRRFYKIGEFELHINLDKQNVDKLQEDNLILLGDFFNKVGIIEHLEKKMNENSTEELLVKGCTLKGIIKRRVTIPAKGQGYDNAVGTQETIIKQFINNNAVNPVDANRKIPQVIIADDKYRGKEDRWRTRYDKLDEKIQEIAEYSELGWDVVLDIENNKWIFDVMEGKNLTVDQDVLPPVTFSVDFDNIKNKHFLRSLLNYKNVAYAGGKGENEERLMQQIGDVSGLDRRETFLDCSQAEDVVEIKSMGIQKLDEYKITESFEAQITPYGSFIYMQDWDLGDIVTVMDCKWEITLNSRITEIKEIYEVNGFNLEATFGSSIPNLLTMFKRNTKKVVR